MRLDRSTERALAALLFPPGEVYEVNDLGSRARLATRLREAAVDVEARDAIEVGNPLDGIAPDDSPGPAAARARARGVASPPSVDGSADYLPPHRGPAVEE